MDTPPSKNKGGTLGLQEPTTEPITKTELAIVRWLEKILSPLIVLAVAGLIGFSLQVSNSMAELRKDHEGYNSNNGKIESSIKELDVKQDKLIKSQYDLEKHVKELEVHQGHVREEVRDLKSQNSEILRILRNFERQLN